MKSAKDAFYKKGAPELIFFNDFFFRKIRMIFDIENSLWKSKIGTFLTNCHQMETQNLVISFDYSWFLAKNLVYAERRIIKFHYRHSSNLHYSILPLVQEPKHFHCIILILRITILDSAKRPKSPVGMQSPLCIPT